MNPTEALAQIKAWRKRDPDAHAAVRALLDSFHYQNLDALFEADPESVLELREALVPLMEMDRTFALEDALNREGRRDLTGRVVVMPPPTVMCPACRGNTETILICPRCGGEGVVPAAPIAGLAPP